MLKGQPVFKYIVEPMSGWSKPEDFGRMMDLLSEFQPLRVDKTYLIMVEVIKKDQPIEQEISENDVEDIIVRNKAAVKARKQRMQEEETRGTKSRITDEQEIAERIQNFYVRFELLVDNLDICLWLFKQFKCIGVKIIAPETGEICGDVTISYQNEHGLEIDMRKSREILSKKAQQYMHRYF